jgi:uncharacterized protein (DUF983 family)
MFSEFLIVSGSCPDCGGELVAQREDDGRVSAVCMGLDGFPCGYSVELASPAERAPKASA